MFLRSSVITCSWLIFTQQWQKAEELGLMGGMALEWEEYLSKLRAPGVYISTREDKMVWEGKTKKGQAAVRDIYSRLPRAGLIKINLTGYKAFGIGLFLASSYVSAG